MSELKRTQLYDVHVAAGATMVDFGGWEMPIQYPSGIIAEHLYTRQVCSLFDVSHMGRLLIEGPQRKEFLQHVLTSNVSALDLNMAQYCIIPNENGGAVDDAYLYLFLSGLPEKTELGKVGQPPLSIHNMNNKSKAGAWL